MSSDGGPFTSLIDDHTGGPGNGPLRAHKVAVKDIFDIEGLPTRLGSASSRDAPPALRDSVAVSRLRNAGARIVGKTALHELALGATGINGYEGTPVNPLDEELVPGGSSSGSAVAVATGAATLALGTDSGGSVRIPAALCGVFGFKPMQSHPHLDGVFPLSPTLDHIGLLGADVSSVIDGWHAISGSPARNSVDLNSIRLLWEEDALEEAAPSIVSSLEDALASIGEMEIGSTRFSSSEEVIEVSSTILSYEASRTHRERLMSRGDLIGDDVAQRLESGLSIGSDEYQSALKRRQPIKREFEAAAGDSGLVISPTIGYPAPRVVDVGLQDTTPRLVRFTRLANLTGLPTATLPLGRRPCASVQIMGRSNELVLSVAALLEQRLGVEPLSPSP